MMSSVGVVSGGGRSHTGRKLRCTIRVSGEGVAMMSKCLGTPSGGRGGRGSYDIKKFKCTIRVGVVSGSLQLQ